MGKSPSKDIPSFTTGATPERLREKENPNELSTGKVVLRTIWLVGVIFFFLLALNLLGESFRILGRPFADELVQITANPFLALFIGILVTALLQSSSLTTALIVVMAGTGELAFDQAAPLVLGANIGTAVTSLIVALGLISVPNEYQKGIETASAHSFFNILGVLIFLPLESTTGLLSTTASNLALLLGTYPLLKIEGVMGLIGNLAENITYGLGEKPMLVIPLGIIAVILSLQLLVRSLRTIFEGNIRRRLESVFFGRSWKGLLTGFVVTSVIQSSSASTSLMVPIVATNKLSLRQAFQFIMGANIGTTLTAVLAAVFTLSDLGTTALGVAFIHVLFNLGTVLIFFFSRRLQNIPLGMAIWLGKLTVKNRLGGIAFVIGVFYALPLLLIFFFR